MSIWSAFRGNLFSSDFLRESIATLADWRDLGEASLEDLEAALGKIFHRFIRIAGSPNESQTEDDLIWPVLAHLGWTAILRQQNLSAGGREDVPDGLLFADEKTKARANGFAEEWKRYQFGLVTVESKRWLRPLDRRSGRWGEETAPSTQMLRYLRRVDDLTTGKLRWGILTNGARWRLYYQGARSVSEQFFEVDLAALLGFSGEINSEATLDNTERRHCLKVFAAIFRREAFLAGVADERTFHQRAIEESQFYEERVAANLSDLVFGEVFPELAGAIASAATEASLEEVREATLVLLYRLLFILYAEDRDLLPVRDDRYDDYALREKVRGDVGRRKDLHDTFSVTAARYWSAIDDLCRAVDAGDPSIGLPPYNGGLFDRSRTPLLENIRLGDRIMAAVIDALSFEQTAEGRRYINYRDLGVQQLGSIYERLLEHEIIHEGDGIAVRPNVFARKGSGSYYTPDDLVGLIIEEAIEPLVRVRMDAFASRVSELASSRLPEDRRMGRLKQIDPAEKLLELKVCDPAMGSGHFLVNLVDHLADRVIEAMAEGETAVEGYVSPLTNRIDVIRNTILGNAEDRGWTVDPAQLDDRHIVRRMVLKRCIYGVDKNPMAVELAKVALWLHTFTVGAPLSFLDHHLRCGDSLFGTWVRTGIDKVTDQAGPLFLRGPINRATRAATSMQIIEGLTDAEIAEAHRSADVFAEIEEMTVPLNAFLSLVHAFNWLNLRDRESKAALFAYFDGKFGDPIEVATGKIDLSEEEGIDERFVEMFEDAQELMADERFFNWQVSFPGVWSNWEDAGLHGGFDAIIGNPPWDRLKLQQVEWFAARRREIALAQRAADRKQMIADLEMAGDPLVQEFTLANERAAAAARLARTCGDYPLLSGGDMNLYSLFVERAMTLVKSNGMVGLLTPTGIASDKTAAKFFKGIITEGRLKALYDFENKKVFFPDVHASFKFCIFIASALPTEEAARCAFYLHCVDELDDPDRCFLLTAEDFAKVNPNTGTAPIFRNRRDAELTTAIYGRLPVLVDRSSGKEVKAWPVKYANMFHMANDSGLFRTHEELQEKEGAYPVGDNRYRSSAGDWLPLYEGKLVQAFDHRASDISVKKDNLFRSGQPKHLSAREKRDPTRYPMCRYYVQNDKVRWRGVGHWVVAFKDITAATNMRTMIAAIIPRAGAGHTLPLLLIDGDVSNPALTASLIVANLNAASFDFVARQKVPATHLTWFVLEQLPVVPLECYETTCFGPRTAGEIIREAVLELTYTAHDLAPFARELGHVDADGNDLPPFVWDENRRLHLRAKLDAVFFHLYGVTSRNDVRYVNSTFPIVERAEVSNFGSYRSCELCLAWMSALAAGEPDAEIDL